MTIRHSAESDRIDSSEAALDISKILTDWPQHERDTLLERALFGFATYGRVRFHHRSVTGYLAAKRLDALLSRGVPIKAVKRLLFAETAQGDKVVRPSMRPIAAWLSIWHEGIFAEVKEREPEVLLNHGDPQSLRPSQRAEILKAYVDRYGKGGWRGLRVPTVQVHRFAFPELSPSVKSIWVGKIENPEVRELIFELIGAGKLVDCADIAYSVAVDAQASHRERIDALGALIALDESRLKHIATSIETDVVLWPTEIARSATLRLFPKYLSVRQLCTVLQRVKERKRSIGDISWKLPQLIAESNFPAAALDELRTDLTALVTEGAEWQDNKWPHVQSKRPDLVTSLMATCVSHFHQGCASVELFRSSVLALRFAEDEHSQEQPAKELRRFLEDASSENREIAFWADDAFLQALHPTKDAWGRVFQLSHYGGVRLTAEKDHAWVLRRLADKTNSVAEREMMLNAAMIELAKPGDDLMKILEGLKAYVADFPPLLKIVEDRMRPAEISEEMRRLEVKSALRKQQSETSSAKARASWIKFWQEIASDPDKVFNSDRADSTAWNLWQAMERSGNESRASGWNRRFIEQQFGRKVADRLRHALLGMWRKYKPTLSSERPAGQKNTFLVKWQLGLAAIAAEAEDPLWATKVAEEEARLAARYAPIELNGFPSWLDALVAAHPKAVDSVFGEELTLSLQDPLDENGATMFLQNVRHASPRVAELFEPRIKAWLDKTRSQRPGKNGWTKSRLAQAIDVLVQSDDQSMRNALRSIAVEELSKGLQSQFSKIWLPLLMQLDPAAGVEALEKGLQTIQPSKRGAGVEWFSTLFGYDHLGPTIDLRRTEFSPKMLLRLVQLAYQHVRPADDASRAGVYSPEVRDNAEQGRNTILNALLATTGSEGWAVKLEMAQDPLFASFKDRVVAIARERAAEEMDSTAMGDSEVVALNTYGEAPPSTRDTMFTLMRDRLDNIDDLLLEDVSPREAWATIKDERVMRREIARELRNHANHIYTVDQEAATADEKETDIRMRAAVSAQQATIELKIGEKPRSAAELRATIKDQLLTKYMAAEDCRSGCLMVTIASDKTWAHPDTNKRLDFAGLIAMLNEEADRLSFEIGGSVRLMAKGLDLRPRLLTERVAKTKSKTGDLKV
ncbi:hypothetical protein NKI25_02840 [Mesorhizobium sp. M0808]|uniref:hypothetical protein n=1 Tax=Mesorhizobium sp. M0808 TaxID=2957002 RepID=UPI00333D4F84